MPTYCCDQMLRWVSPTCVDHTDPHACSDALVHHDREFDTYGLIVHDGGSSCVDIIFCPWCGKKLAR